MEKTLILLKPDCVEQKKCGEVIKRFEDEKFNIDKIKEIELTDEILKEHYSHVADLPFFPEILNFMKSSKVIGIVFSRENAVDKAREILGVTDSQLAEKGTIRGDLGTDKMKNIAHASDSVENAQIEITRFFC